MEETLTLEVMEAEPKDVGNGRIRIDPKDMEIIGVKLGDVVSIQGKRTTAARPHPMYPEKRGRQCVQIDSITRENAGIELGEKVVISKIAYVPAQKLTLRTSSSKEIPSQDVLRSLERVALVVSKGDRIRATLFSGTSEDFSVEAVVPDVPAVVTSTTKIQVRSKEGRLGKHASERISYENIGGLGKEIQKIREMIELPLKFPEVFERLGIDAPKGVLLHGPPGCGKTLIAKAVANKAQCNFYQISGPEIFHKFYGESEQHLRTIFEQARANTPAIIFIDEIDAIASKREGVREDQQVERRVSAQLLALLDGLKNRGQVIVIGATNIPNSLDPALRRPGRFDREIEIGMPDMNARLEILDIHSRGMPLAKDVNLSLIAGITHGFTGADLEDLCREAAMHTLRTLFPDIDFISNTIPLEKLEETYITMEHFNYALAEIEPSGLREVLVEIPDVGWEDIGGLDVAKQRLKDSIELPLKDPELFAYAATTPPRGILLYGLPGTGKTLLAKAVAKESGANFISIKGPELMSKFIGESERGIREMFRKARQSAPCVIFFDEIDAITPHRGKGDSSNVTDRTISQLLTELDGAEALRGVVVIAATNRKDIIDPALLRAGRFDFLIKLPVPDYETRLKIFEIHARSKHLAPDIKLARFVEETEGWTGADIEALTRMASLLAIREFSERETDRAKRKLENFTVEKRHFEEAFGQIRSQRTEE